MKSVLLMDILLKKSDVNVNVGNAQFKFETKGNFAWMTSLDDELKMIRAMKKANKAQVIGVSSRGNKTYLFLDWFYRWLNSAKKIAYERDSFWPTFIGNS